MAQYKKDQIKENIDAAALKVFSRKGYQAAKISDISACAGVSVGNIYRYYKNKDEIFYSVVLEEFPTLVLEEVRGKISSEKLNNNAGGSIMGEITEAFIQFMLSNRERILILFSGSSGTRYSGLRNELVESLLSIVSMIYPDQYDSYLQKFGNDDVLRLIYENLIEAYSQILNSDAGDDAELINKISQIDLYHFSGIIRLLDI
jgi:AcrR family transcriptional regulator